MQTSNLKENPSWEKQHEILVKEINQLRCIPSHSSSGMPYAPPTIGSPNRTMNVDYGVFEQDPVERGKTITAKKQHRQSLQKVYGRQWKNHLNVPEKSIGFSIHHTF